MRTPQENEAMCRTFVDEVFNNRKLGHAEESLAEDFVEHNPWPGTDPTKAGAVEGFRKMIEASPDLRAEILDLVATGNKVALRGTFSGTDTGGLMPGAPATGKPFSAESIDVVTIDDDGKFVEHYGILDVPAVMMQIGLMPVPGE